MRHRMPAARAFLKREIRKRVESSRYKMFVDRSYGTCERVNATEHRNFLFDLKDCRALISRDRTFGVRSN